MPPWSLPWRRPRSKPEWPAVHAPPEPRAAAEGAEAALADAEASLPVQPAMALQNAEQVLRAHPQSPRALRVAAAAAAALGDTETALDHFTLLLHLEPHDAASAASMAALLRGAGQPARAVRLLERQLERDPAQAVLRLELAQALYAQARHDDAAEQLRRVLAAEPGHAAALNLLGLIVARETGDLAEGEALVRAALRAAPEWNAASSNLGWILAEQGRLAEALELFSVVLERAPGDAETRFMRASALLKQGRFREGWRDYEARHDSNSPSAVANRRAAAAVHAPRLGSLDSVAGRRVRVLAEQGLGDQIMFASCLPDLIARGAHCTVECEPRLKALFERSFPAARFSAERASGEASDFQLMAGSLPGFLRNGWEDFPRHEGFLRADPAAVSAWRNRLAELGPGLKLGVSWRGGMSSTRRQLRSLALDELLAPLAGRGHHFISLQYGDCAPELAALPSGLPPVHHWPDELSDYDRTAALVTALDGVISVCTAVVHLTGSLGKPAWVLTPAVPEWRYLAEGTRMPWYPSVHLVRQSHGEPWGPVVERARRLAEMALG